MSSAESSKNLAGIGSILLIFPFVSIIGIILVFIGMKGLSEYYKEPSIYQNALWGLIFGIIAVIAVAIAVPLVFLGGLFGGALGLGFGLLTLFGVLAIVFVFYVISAMYLRKAFATLSQKTGEHSFETAGNLLWIGSIVNNSFRHRLNSDIYRLDICYNRVLCNEGIFPTNWLCTTSTTASNFNTNTSNSILPKLRRTSTTKHYFLS